MTDTPNNPPPAPAPGVGTLERAIGLVDTFTRMPTVKAAVLAIVLTACAVAWQQQDKLVDHLARNVVQRLDDRRERQHATALQDAVVRTRQVSAALDAIRGDLGAARATMHEYHNGSESLRGVPFLFSSATAEVVAPGVSRERERLQRVALETTIEWVPAFLRRECIAKRVADAGPTLAAVLGAGGAEVIVACPVYVGAAREPAAFLTLDYTRGYAAPGDPAQAEARLRDAARLIGAVLAAYLESQRVP